MNHLIMLKFLYLVNKQGQPRIIKYFEDGNKNARHIQETDIIRKCLLKNEKNSNFIEHKGVKIVFRKYATLYFIVGVDDDENELAVLEFIHNLVETFDKYFNKVCELDIMFNLDRVHMILDEMICNGCIVEGSKSLALSPVQVMDQVMNK